MINFNLLTESLVLPVVKRSSLELHESNLPLVKARASIGQRKESGGKKKEESSRVLDRFGV